MDGERKTICQRAVPDLTGRTELIFILPSVGCNQGRFWGSSPIPVAALAPSVFAGVPHRVLRLAGLFQRPDAPRSFRIALAESMSRFHFAFSFSFAYETNRESREPHEDGHCEQRCRWIEVPGTNGCVTFPRFERIVDRDRTTRPIASVGGPETTGACKQKKTTYHSPSSSSSALRSFASPARHLAIDLLILLDFLRQDAGTSIPRDTVAN